MSTTASSTTDARVTFTTDARADACDAGRDAEKLAHAIKREGRSFAHDMLIAALCTFIVTALLEALAIGYEPSIITGVTIAAQRMLTPDYNAFTATRALAAKIVRKAL